METNKPSSDETFEFAQSIINTVREPLIVLDQDLRVVSASHSFYQAFKVNPEETVGQLIYDLGNQQWNIPKLRELLETILPQRTTFENYEVEHDFADIGRRIMLLNARQIKRVWGKERIILLAIEDITERRQLETLLEVSEKRYRRLFETANDGILLLDKLEGNIAHANPAITAMLGYSEKELSGKHLKDVGFPYDMGVIQELLQALEQDGIIHYKDTLIQKKTGQVLYTDIYMVDKTDLLQCNVRDITERKQADAASKAFLDSIINTMADSVFVKNDKLRFVIVNDAFCAMVGHPKEELIGRNDEEIFCKEEAEVFMKSDTHVLDTGKENFNEESLTNLLSGKAHTIVTRKTRYIDPTGNRFIVGVIRDITERKRAERALILSEEKFRKVVLTNPDSIVITRLVDSVFVLVNQSFLELSGYTEEAVIGKSSLDLNVWENSKDRERILEKLSAGDSVKNFESCFRKKNGEVGSGLISASIINLNGLPHVLTITRDLTERKRAEEEKADLEARLQQARKMEAIGTLAGGIAHDFNNILAAILGYTELAVSNLPQDSDIRKNLEEVVNASHRAIDLVKQILTFSLRSEKQLFPISIRPVIKEVLKLLRASIPATIEINQNIRASGKVLADITQIHQIMMNLCTNASHAMSENGGVLSVSLIGVNLPNDVSVPMDLPPGPYLKLTVSDTGCGMTPNVLSRIFEPYYTTKKTDKGTGLGLAVVHGIVESHGGLITVESTPGKGSCFHLYLPEIMDSEKDKETIQAVAPDVTGTERILFVDDELTIVRMGKIMLESLGYKVTGTTSGAEALELFKANPAQFDLVITDMTMPHMTGYQFSGKLIEIRPDIPIILSSGYSEKMTEEATQKFGIREFIMKPISRQVLSKTIRNVLDSN